MTQLVIIVGYLALLVIVGLLSSRLSRGTGEDYMLASHTIGPFLLLMSLFGTTMTAFALVGSTGEAYKAGIGVYGMLASSSGIVHSLCFFLIGVKLWSFGKQYGYTTQIQFFRDRLESNAIGLLLFPILVGLVIPYLLIGVLGAGGAINGVTRGAFPDMFEAYQHGVPPWLASLVICVIVLTYVFLGGMRGTAWANAFQTCVFMILGVATFVLIADKIGGKDGLLANLQAATDLVAQSHPEKLTRTGIDKFKFASYMLIPLSVGMFPHVFQHWLTARSAESFKLPIIAHPIFIMIVWAPCVLVGVWATSAVMPGGELVIPEVHPPNTELAILVGKLTGPIVGGLLTAGILAAVMSSLDSQFLCIGSMFTNDIVLHYAGKERFSERQIVLIARLFVVAIVAVTYAISLLHPTSVFALGIWCFSGFTGLVPLVVAALYWRRLTKAGAAASIVVTAATWLYFLYDALQQDALRTYEFQGMMPILPITICSIAALIAVSSLTKPPSDVTLAKFFP